MAGGHCRYSGHRHETCGNCLYYKGFYTGECRKRSPEVAGWPKVKELDACGSWTEVEGLWDEYCIASDWLRKDLTWHQFLEGKYGTGG